MKLKLFQVDAFATRVFEGNPAAVCPLDAWVDDEILQKIAQENNLSETAFLVKAGEGFALRWFTPVGGGRPMWSCDVGSCQCSV
ncbi:MAG: PhzF family phenazine biosynthesis protein [Bermanella sp.]